MDHNDFSQEMGPGMDLMVSLFALAMLIIALISIENQELQVESYSLSSKSLKIFEQNEAQLTDEGEKQIGVALEQLYPAFRDVSANAIRLVGHADPKPRPMYGDMDGNMDLSAGRSVSVAHELHRRGVPYECIVIQAHGSTRSQRATEAREDHGIDREAFERYLADNRTGSFSPSQIEVLDGLQAGLWEDRKVEIIPARDKDVPCTAEQLIGIIATIVEG